MTNKNLDLRMRKLLCVALNFLLNTNIDVEAN